MPTHLPEIVDPYRLANKGESLSGDIAVASMARLSQILVDKETGVSVKLVFGYGEQRRLTINGVIDADLVLRCERCLGPMPWPLQLEFTLVLVKAGNQGEVPPEYEQYIMESDKIRLSEMIEDEVLLSMPQVAKHETEACPAAGYLPASNTDKENDSDTERKNPFAVLKNLKSE